MKFNKRAIILVLALVFVLAALTGCTPAGNATNAEGTGGSMYSSIIMIVVLIAVFYFFLIRPENKKKKKAQEMRDSLAVGDTITTIGGMIGKIVHISDDFIVFETGDDRVRIKIAKWAISTSGKAKEEPK